MSACGLLVALAHEAEEQRGIDTLFSRHYSLLARKVAERSAETGEHYITRNAAEYRAMLHAALGGGAVIAATTFAKFALLALGLSAFWGGLWAGVNYAASFVLIYLLHWTVATKQPAMTAPAMAHKLVDMASDDSGRGLRRRGREPDPLAGGRHHRQPRGGGSGGPGRAVRGNRDRRRAADRRGRSAQHVLETTTLWGPTALFAAFTGVLLFASSLIAGWAENWFVWHRLDSAIAWNPRIVARLGQARAARWAHYLRSNISGLVSNISLGLMLGLVPAVALFFATSHRGAPRHAVERATRRRGGRARPFHAAARRVLVVRGGHRCDRRVEPGRQFLPRLQGGAALARYPPARAQPGLPGDPHGGLRTAPASFIRPPP